MINSLTYVTIHIYIVDYFIQFDTENNIVSKGENPLSLLVGKINSEILEGHF